MAAAIGRNDIGDDNLCPIISTTSFGPKTSVHHQLSFVMFEGDSKYVTESLHQPSTSNLDFLMPCFDFFRNLEGWVCPKQNILISWLTILNADLLIASRMSP